MKRHKENIIYVPSGVANGGKVGWLMIVAGNV